MSVRLTSTRSRVNLTSSRTGSVLTPTRPRIVLTADRQGRPGADGDPGEGVPTGGTTGQVLTKDSATDYDTSWQDAAGGGASAVDDLTDVTITAAATGDVLRYNGTAWVDYADSNYAAASHGHTDLQDATTIVRGATAGAGGDQTIPDGTSFLLIFGSIGTVTLPDVVTNAGQVLTIFNQSGATVTVSTAGSDLFLPPGSTSTTTLGDGSQLQLSALDLTGIFGTFWIPALRSGPDYDIPFWNNLSYPDGYAVAMSSGTPQWVDPISLSDPDPVWAAPPTVTTNVMRLDYAGNPGTADGAWSTDEPADLDDDGVDIRCRIWFDYPSDVTPPSTDRYMEVITQEHPTSDGGDTFEAAILWADDSFGTGVIEGQPHTFYESAKVGIGSGTERNAGWKRAGLKAREWVDLRWTQEYATDTVTYWRAVPFQVSDATEQVDGTWWYPLSSVTHADFGGIDDTATSDWWIGLRFTGYLAWMKVQNFARDITYVDINAADLDALALGAQSFTDDAGNTWTSVAGEIVAAPEPANTSTISLLVTDPGGADVATGDGQAYFTVPAELDGAVITDVHASFTTAATGSSTIQIHNVTDAADVLSTKVTIDSTERTSYTAAASVISAGTLATGDLLRVDVDTVGTGAKGLQVMLTVTS